MMRIAIIVGSTRPGRRGANVGAWVHSTAGQHPANQAGIVEFTIVDLVDFALPVLDEPVPAAFGTYANEHTKRWSEVIESFDGYVFVTSEYNRGVPGALKNAVDFLYPEWHDKPAGLVGYGVHGARVAMAQWRVIMSELKLAVVPTEVGLLMFDDFTFDDPTDPTDLGTVEPAPRQAELVHKMLDEIITSASNPNTTPVA